VHALAPVIWAVSGNNGGATRDGVAVGYLIHRVGVSPQPSLGLQRNGDRAVKPRVNIAAINAAPAPFNRNQRRRVVILAARGRNFGRVPLSLVWTDSLEVLRPGIDLRPFC
jgi:hypothetical protein